MVNNKYYLILAVFIVQVTAANAQTSKSLSEQINVVRPYKPILAESVKITGNPEITDEKPYIPDISYKINSKKLDSLPPFKSADPEKIKPESISKLYKSYLKAGFGNYSTAYGEVYLTNTRSRDMQVGGFLKHHSSTGKIKNADFSKNQASVFVNKTFKDYLLNASGLYDRDVVHFYGYDHEKFTETGSSTFQQFNFAGMDASLSSRITEDSSLLSHAFTVKSYSMSDNFRSYENRFYLGSDLGTFIYSDKISLAASIDLSSYKTLEKSSNAVLSLFPCYTVNDSAYIIHAGLKLINENGINTKLHLYPHLTGEYLVMDDLRIYGGITGVLRKNTFRELSQENPFLGRPVQLLNTNEKLEVFGGIRGNINSQTGFRVNVSSTTADNMHFFINNPVDSTRFLVVYDGDGANVLHFTGEGTFQQSEKLRMSLQIHTYKFNMASLEFPWHHPEFKVMHSATYNIGNKFLLGWDFFWISKTMAKSIAQPGAIELRPITDLNLSLDYRYSKTLSFFTKLNNLTGTKYERWLNYPGYGFNGLLGATLAL